MIHFDPYFILKLIIKYTIPLGTLYLPPTTSSDNFFPKNGATGYSIGEF